MRFLSVIPHVFAVATWLAPVSVAQESQPASTAVRTGPRVIDAAAHLVGRRIADVAFTDLDGKSGRLSDYRDRALLVVCMTATDCPIANKYAPRLVELEAKYRDKKVEFLLVNPQAHETDEDMRASVARFGIAARYAHDSEGQVAAALEATSTTEVFVLDPTRTLVYRGAVDDQYGLGYTIPEVRQPLLTHAIDALLVGMRPPVAATTAPGCELALDEAELSATTGDVTWHNRISRIVQDNCQVCHRPNAAGPFELLTYEDAKDHAKTIRREVERLAMPPWFADGPRGQWSNDTRLTDEDRRDLLAWIAAGSPEGDPKDAPLPRQWTDGWQIKPDAIYHAEHPIEVAAQGAMPYQEVFVRLNLPEDKWIGAIEILNDHPEVMHHILAFRVFPPGHPLEELQLLNTTGARGCYAWAVPGWTATRYPPDTAKLLPAGVDILLQIHYTPNGVAVKDLPSVGVEFVDQPTYELKTRAASNEDFAIPPGAEHFAVDAEYEFDRPTRIMSFFPHTHLRGVGFEYEIHYPDGTVNKILDLPRYDFNWQMTYTLADPLDVPAGTVMKAKGWYDNSAKNPANPDPTATVRNGQQSWDEMMVAYVTTYSLSTPDAPFEREEWGSLSMKRRIKVWVRRNTEVALSGGLLAMAGLIGLTFWFRTRRRAAL
jgi:mono/diheme cytochrome c family protein/thiol-disulfide isomerase/thioredoxin